MTAVASASAHKGYRAGTDRLRTPSGTLAWVRPFHHDFGLTRVANVTGLDIVGIPVYTACRPNSRSLAVTQGKGLTADAAAASAVMESIEAYHAETIDAPLLLGSAEELARRYPLVNAADLPTGESGPYSSLKPQLWIEGFDIASDDPRWVPLDLVHSDFTYARRLGTGMFDVTSNGLASGNHVLEATSHALSELIERDATALWTMLDPDARARTQLNLATVDDPSCRSVLAKLETAGIAVAVWSTTSDVGLPSFMCNIAEDPDQAVMPLYAAEGMGCHPKREIALLRALTEAAQSRLTLISGSRDDVFRYEYARLRDGTALRLMWETVRHGRGLVDFASIPTFENDRFDDDVQVEIDQLAAAGMTQVVIVDLTKPRYEVPVVRALVPGLECFVSAARYRPGRRALEFRESLGAGSWPR